MNKKAFMIGLAMAAAVSAIGCTKKNTDPVSTSGSASIVDYSYDTKTSKSFINFNNDLDKQIDVSADVTKYNKGDLWLTETGVEKVFDLKRVEMSDDDKRLLEQYEKENSYTSESDHFIKLENKEHYFLFREGSTLFVCDGNVKNMESSVIVSDNIASFPLFDLVFGLGYDSIGTSINENIVNYTIYLPVPVEATPVDASFNEPETEKTNDEIEANKKEETVKKTDELVNP